MSLGYLLRRVLVFVLVMWAAMTLIFFLPKLAPGRDPIQDRMAMLAATGGANTANIADMVKAYQSNFGLDQPLYVQYFRYLGNIVRLDFNYSLAQYPAKVIDLITISLPQHPYTQLLVGSIPMPNPKLRRAQARRHPRGVGRRRHGLPFRKSLPACLLPNVVRVP